MKQAGRDELVPLLGGVLGLGMDAHRQAARAAANQLEANPPVIVANALVAPAVAPVAPRPVVVAAVVPPLPPEPLS